MLRAIFLSLLTGAVLSTFGYDGYGQKAVNKFPRAIERSGDAARIISLLSNAESGLPKELIDQAKAIGVFPKVTKETSMFTQVTQGFGVISARLETGWTAPAFYAFGGGGYGKPFARTEMSALILLWVAAFEKGRVQLSGEKKGVAGAVGTITEEQRKELAGAQVVAYSYYNGKLSGTVFQKSFWKSFALNPDNKINNPLYHMKGREVLAGKKIDEGSLPSGILAFQEALKKHWPAR